jgi:hypothetical protein
MMSSVRRWFALVVVAAAATVGCSKDKEVLAFVSDFDAFSNEIVKQVKSAPNASAGVEAAQKYLDENKARVQQKMSVIKEVKNFQITDETKKKMETSIVDNVKTVAGLQIEYMGQVAMDRSLQAKFEKLIKDYHETITK